MKRLLLAIIAVGFALSASAKIELPHILGSHMVLQQNAMVNLWGKATPNAKVNITVSWAPLRRVQTTADKDGNWATKIDTPAATFDPQTIKISDGGRISVGGNNTAFGGTLVLSGAGVPDAWNRVGFTNAAAFGSAATTVQVNGRGFYFGDKEITASSDVQIIGNSAGNLLDGSTDQKITFTGDWSVAEDAAFGATADGPNVSYTVTFAGDISDFKGTLRTRSNNTWVLGGDSVAGAGAVDMKEIVGDGKLTVKYSKDTVLNSVVGGTVNLTQSGEGKLQVELAQLKYTAPRLYGKGNGLAIKFFFKSSVCF